MFRDERKYHDHGSKFVSCSNERHRALATGLINPRKEGYVKADAGYILVNPLLAFFVQLEFLFEYARFVEEREGVYHLLCACCLYNYGTIKA
jgi:hypothetical protein